MTFTQDHPFRDIVTPTGPVLPERGRHAGLALAVVAALLTLLRVPPLLGQGFEWAAAAVGAATGATAALGLTIWARPGRGADLLDRIGVPRTGGGAIGFCIVAGVVATVFGAFALGQTVLGVEHVLDGGTIDELFAQPTFAGVLVNVVINLLLLGFAAAGYLHYAHRRSLAGIVEDLDLAGGPKAVAEGVAWGLGGLFAMGLIGVGLVQLGVGPEPNVLADLITQTLTLPQALAVSFLAALGEEIFFRGFLQPRIGLIPQAVLFGAIHATYLNGFEVLGTFVLALAFGMAYRRTDSLYAPIAGHFAANALVFVVAQYAPPA